ncbi:MAG: hypothetical protein ACK56F_14480, partial [bacterium]
MVGGAGGGGGVQQGPLGGGRAAEQRVVVCGRQRPRCGERLSAPAVHQLQPGQRLVSGDLADRHRQLAGGQWRPVDRAGRRWCGAGVPAGESADQ